MSPLEEPPEQRWRRTLDRRQRPAKLKVARLLQDFGYAELDPEVADAIEARLAAVALGVAPSLSHAAPGEIVTLYSSESAPPLLHDPAAVRPARPGPAGEPADTNVAEMISHLKQQLLDTRAEADRLRTELAGRADAASTDIERETESIVAEQAAALEEQRRQIAELGAALAGTRQALAETRDEIRRVVGELRAPLDPTALDPELPPAADPTALDPALPVEVDPSALDREPPVPVDPTALDLEPPPPGDLGAAPPDPAQAAVGDEQELDEVGLGTEDQPVRREEPASDAGRPAPGVQEEPAPGGEAPVPDVGLVSENEPEPDVAVSELDTPDVPDAADVSDVPDVPDVPDAPDAPDVPDVPLSVGAERSEDSDRPPPQSDEWLPEDFRPSAGEERPAAEALPAAGESAPDDGPTDFDDFLYDPDELYDPGDRGQVAVADEPLESEIVAQWPDEPTSALPPPPPVPPSPWAGDPQPPRPAVRGGRAQRSGARRGRGGRVRGRWEGSCSICGRLPQKTRRKDLEAAGWDINDEAAACPQCRGVG